MALVAKVMIEWFLVVFSEDLNEDNHLRELPRPCTAFSQSLSDNSLQ